MRQRAKVIFISGGQRSGKSRLAEQMVLSLTSNPVYIATARVLDDEMRRRVDIHQQRRGRQWTNLEAPISFDDITLHPGDVALLDCLTMLATNIFLDSGEDSDRACDITIERLDRLFTSSPQSTIVVVTNEIGLGGIASNPMQRHFADMQGKINQWVAAIADEAYLTVSGLPITLKAPK